MTIDVMVAIPSNGIWRAETGASLALMVGTFLHGKAGRRIHIYNPMGSMLVQNRHFTVRDALRMKVTHLLFVDSDMAFPADSLERLLAHDKEFVATNCVRRRFPIEGTAMDFDGKIINSAQRTGLEKVQHVGLAFALIKREALLKLQPPLFSMEWIPQVKDYCGEDVYFSHKLQAAGVDLWVDHDLSKEITHIGSMEYAWTSTHSTPR